MTDRGGFVAALDLDHPAVSMTLEGRFAGT